MNVFFLILALAMLVAVTLALSKAKKPFLSAVKSAITGVAGLLLVNLTSGATGCYIAINLYTTFIATVLSLPGVVALLVMKLLFNY